MAIWVNIVETNCADASREEEFNNWYDNIHIPDILETPGFLSATRYMIKEPQEGRGKYLTVYEIETEDMDKTMEVRREKRLLERDRGRYIDFLELVREVQYRVLGTQRSK